MSSLKDFNQCKEHLTGQLAEFRKAIERYPNVGYNDRPTEYLVIRNKYNTIESELNEWSSSAVTWPPKIKHRAEEEIARMREELEMINNSFTANVSEENRNKLLGDVKVELEDTQVADILLDGVDEATKAGTAILDNLAHQRSTITNISSNLSKMDKELDEGESILNEIECRGRTRRMFLIGVYVFLGITFLVFIYYILR